MSRLPVVLPASGVAGRMPGFGTGAADAQLTHHGGVSC